MTTEQRLVFNEQITVRMPNVLLNRVDSLAKHDHQTRGAWLRTAILEKVRSEERMLREEDKRDSQ
jgi:predicted transcriptional regulator